MYIINADLVTGVNGLSYLKGQIVDGSVFLSINDLLSIGAITLQVEPKVSKKDPTV